MHNGISFITFIYISPVTNVVKKRKRQTPHRLGENICKTHPRRGHVLIIYKKLLQPDSKMTTPPCLPGKSRSGPWWAPGVLPGRWGWWPRREGLGRQVLVWDTIYHSSRDPASPSPAPPAPLPTDPDCAQVPVLGWPTFIIIQCPGYVALFQWGREPEYSLSTLGYSIFEAYQNSQSRHHFCWENTLKVNEMENTCECVLLF